MNNENITGVLERAVGIKGDIFLLILEQWKFWLHEYYYLPGIIGALLIVVYLNSESLKVKILLLLLIIANFLFQPLGTFLPAKYLLSERVFVLNDFSYFKWWIINLSSSLFIIFYCMQLATNSIDRIKNQLTRRAQYQREGRIDADEIERYLPRKVKYFDPRKQMNFKKGIYIGKDPNGKSSYITYKDAVDKHWMVCGSTGTGKTVFFQMMAYQFLKKSCSIITIDPKNDEFFLSVIKRCADEMGLKTNYINLEGLVPAINPFYGKNSKQIADILIMGGKLSDSGTDGDYYTQICRRAARRFGEFAEGSEIPPRQLVSEFIEQEGQNFKEATRLFEILEELCSLDIVNTSKGIDIEKEIKAGNPIYFAGSLHDESIQILQRMIVTSIMQVCKSRPKNKGRRIILFMDEFGALVNKLTVEIMGTLRSKRTTVFIAHQTLSDLKQTNLGLDPQAVVTRIFENTGNKYVYKIMDPDTAELYARYSGKNIVDVETRGITRNSFFSEVSNGDKTLHESDSYRVDPNIIHNLPSGCAVVYGFDKPKYVYSAFIPVPENHVVEQTAYQSNPCEERVAPSNKNFAEDLIDVDS